MASLSNPICCICEKNEAGLFCKCTDTPTLFCVDCSARHHAKHPRAFHQVMPMAALSQDPEKFRLKSQILGRAVAELQKNVERVEQYCVEVAAMMQNCIDYLTEYRSKALQQLQREKVELVLAIHTAIEEATSCLDQGIEPVSALAQAIWAPTKELQAFSYTVNCPDLHSLCQNWANSHNPLKAFCDRLNSMSEEGKEEQIPPQLFAAVLGNRMELYDLNTQRTTKHRLPTEVYSGYLQNGTTVLVVGKEVLTLDLLTLQVTPQAPLTVPRDYVGVAQVGNSVFAFGGSVDSRSSIRVCEKSSVPPTHWTPLPPMRYARSSFTPCVFKVLLYLVSTRAEDHRAVETFNPRTETFTVLPVSLPADLKLGWGSVAFVADGELILLTYQKQAARWEIEQECGFRVSATDRECWSLHPPLVVGTVAFVANIHGPKVEKWSFEANRLT